MLEHKIKTVEEICQCTAGKTVVMCHGVFDIVHPGHIRHLMYAKEKGDILVASLTCDKFIEKGDGRPYIPQELRAKNLAALELVDYVIIDNNSTPIENIRKLKPDIFVKGFEYKEGNNTKTNEEITAVESYGGEVVFSPGDVIYSSTALLSYHKPKLSFEKLTAIMEAEKVSFQDILNTLNKFQGIKVHVIGDLIIDKYTYCSVLGPTTKTPTFSVKKEKSDLFIGGAGVVAKHLQNLGADVYFSTVCGEEHLDFINSELKNIHLQLIVDKSRPTTVKERFWAGGYKLIQVDIVDNSIISDKILAQLDNNIYKSPADIFIFSDFRHGIFQKKTIKELIKNVPRLAIKIADTQVSNRWGNILDFKDFDIVLPNEKEARFALGDQDTGIRPLGQKLYQDTRAKYLILKLGDKGIITYRGSTQNPRDFFAIDSLVMHFVDANGAGDTMLAVSSLAYKVSHNILISSILGSLGAAVECEKDGNVPITVNEIKKKLEELK